MSRTTSQPPVAPTSRPSTDVDVVVVGARVAGASTAMLLARRGLRVVLLDRAPAAGTDTLSTHALMRAGVLQLTRWGLLDQVIAAGTPPIGQTIVHYDTDVEPIDIREKAGVSSLYAPRRTVLDRILVEAARAAGVDVRFAAPVRSLQWSNGRVTGVRVGHSAEDGFEVRAPLVIGADGARSLIARAVDAPTTWEGAHSSAILYGYWPRPGAEGYRWFYRPRATAGVIPTNDDQVCFWVGAPTTRFFTEHHGDLTETFAHLAREAAPEVCDRFPAERRLGRIRGFAGLPGYLRRASGPGWALVGDAGAFRDPLSAHGITDALRDAEILAEDVVATLGRAGTGRSAPFTGLPEYEATREQVALPLARITDRVASYHWSMAELREILIDLSRAMNPGVELLSGLDRGESRHRVADAVASPDRISAVA